MNSQEFLAKTFPLVVRWDGGKAPVDWFHDVGIVRVGGEFVVKVWPHWKSFEGDVPSKECGCTYRGSYAYGWDGLEVEIVEHGVGQIERASFEFEKYCVTRAHENNRCREHHDKLAILTSVWHEKPEFPELLYPVWECERPTEIETELLLPMQRYIAGWL